MNTIYERNGFIFIKSDDINHEYPWWVTTDYANGEPYFLLNCYTKELFLKFYGPLIANKKFTINPYLFDDIRNFKQNQHHEVEHTLITSHREITLKEHQIKALTLMLKYDRYALFYGTGTGKTLITIFYLMITKPKRVLIVTPKKVVAQYKKEVMNRLADTYRIEQSKVLNDSIVIVNPESLHKIKYTWIDCLIIDESHKAKNYMSEVNKQLRTLAKHSSNIYLFSGTPQDKIQAEIFPQLAILDERVFPSKTRFIYRYFKLDDYHNPKTHKREFKPELLAMINAYSYGVKSRDVIELPEMHNIKIPVAHPGQVYTTLEKKRVAKILSNDLLYLCYADLPTILRTKLQEICSGFLLNVETSSPADLNTRFVSDVLTLKSKKCKMNVLETMLTKARQQYIIFTCFSAEIPLVAEVLDKLNYSYAVINGDTSIEETNKIKMELKDNIIDVIIANVKCTSEGLDLYFINNIIFYSLPDSYITYHQCCSRINRIGQTKETFIYNLVCENTVEEDKYLALSKKQDYNNKLFNNYILRKEV